MEFECKKCAKCCKELVTFIREEDLNRWISEGRQDILSCLTWHMLHGRVPPELLFIPKKQHIIQHSFLKPIWNKKLVGNNECIFLNNDRCTIYNTRPTTCEMFPKSTLNYKCPGIKKVTIRDKIAAKAIVGSKRAQDVMIYKNKQLINKMVNKAKEMTDFEKIKKIIIIQEVIN